MLRVSERASKVEYAIRDIVVHARALERRGRRVIYLNLGDPVKYGFGTPQHIKEALKKAVEEGYNWYSPSEGLPELKQAISEKERDANGIDISQEDVVVTSGTSEGILYLMGALTDPGDEVLVPGPCYPPYVSYLNFLNGKPIAYRTIEEESWKPDLDDLRSKVTHRSRALVIINPNNPCGAVYDEKTVREVINIAGQHDLVVISDEIYDRIVFDQTFISAARLAKDVPVVGVNGFSKTYLMTGWRVGYVYFHDPQGRLTPIKEAVERLTRTRLSGNTPGQVAAIEALRGAQDHIGKMVAELRRRRDYMCKRLSELEGITCTKPDGAFYVFPKVQGVGKRWKSDEEFVLKLLEETGVLVVHGSGFDAMYGAGHFRAVFLPPIPTLEIALDELARFLRLH